MLRLWRAECHALQPRLAHAVQACSLAQLRMHSCVEGRAFLSHDRSVQDAVSNKAHRAGRNKGLADAELADGRKLSRRPSNFVQPVPEFAPDSPQQRPRSSSRLDSGINYFSDGKQLSAAPGVRADRYYAM